MSVPRFSSGGMGLDIAVAAAPLVLREDTGIEGRGCFCDLGADFSDPGRL